jgi:hypothetical protein
MRSGLSTTSNGNLLETQGMFSLRASDVNGNLLDIDPNIGIYVQVPVDEIKPGMQLYQGEFDENKRINWVNPTPMEKIPVPVDMASLNFYPTGYEDTLNKLQLNQGKKYRDSLYLACELINVEIQTTSTIPMSLSDSLFLYQDFTKMSENDLLDFIEKSNKIYLKSVGNTSGYDGPRFIGVPPSSVLAFWKPKFNNTNLAPASLNDACKPFTKLAMKTF